MNIIKTSIYNLLLASLIALVAQACALEGGSRSAQPATRVSVELKPTASAIDTAHLLDEWKALASLTQPAGGPSRSFDVSMVVSDTAVTAEIWPKLSDRHRQNFIRLLDTLTRHPSPIPRTLRNQQLSVNETDTSLLRLLALTPDTTFALLPDLGSAHWTYTHREVPGYAGMSQSYVTTYLTYQLRQPIPSLQYRLGFAPSASGEENPIRESMEAIMQQLPPSSADYSIGTGDPIADSLWQRLRGNQRLTIDSNTMQIRWTSVDFNFRPFTPILDQDTLFTVSVAKLLEETTPEVYHLLLAPELTRIMAAYRMDDDE